MGGGTFTRTAWTSYAGEVRSKSREQVFTQRQIHFDFDPTRIAVRESRDSAEHPASTAIILGLDVTGSMGMIAEHIAKEGLGELVLGLLSSQPVSDPQIAVAGIGDAYCDSAPFQVSQFESDIRIGEQLKNLWLEGGGGGNSFESYDLAWYFAANRTSTDCFEKRGKKGYLFTFGDELVPGGLASSHTQKIFTEPLQAKMSAKDLYEAASEKWNVFHIIVEEGNYAKHSGSARVLQNWRDLMGFHAIPLSNYRHLASVVQAVIQVAEGMSADDAILACQDTNIRKTITHALKD